MDSLYGAEAPVSTFGADHGGFDSFVESIQLLSVSLLTFLAEIDVFRQLIVNVTKSGRVFGALWAHVEESLLLTSIDPLSGNRSEHAQVASGTLRLELGRRNPWLATALSGFLCLFLILFLFYLFDLLIEIVL